MTWEGERGGFCFALASLPLAAFEIEFFLITNERRTNEVKFNMRLRLRVSDSEGNFRQPP